MTSRERVFAVLERKDFDRIPLDGSFRPEVWGRLQRRLEVDGEQLREMLGIDIRHIQRSPSYEYQQELELNRKLFDRKSSEGELQNWLYLGDGVFTNEWGVKRRLEQDRHYYQYVYHPLADKDNVKGYKFPDVDAPGCFDAVERLAKLYKDKYALVADIQHFFRHGWELRGFQQYLMDLHLNPRFIFDLNERLLEFKCEEIRKYLSFGIRIIGLIGDIAMQTGMLFSLQMWKKYFSPYMARLIEFARSLSKEKIYFYFHSDGNCEDVIPDLIDIGIDILNPIQPECMDPIKIKRLYGKYLTLYGTISVQKTLPFGSPEDVKREVLERIKECGYDGGLIIAPSNVIQEDVPDENVLTLYKTVQEYNYRL